MDRSINERIAVVETRCELLPEIAKDVRALRDDMSNLKVKVAGVAGAVAVLTTIGVELALKLFQ